MSLTRLGSGADALAIVELNPEATIPRDKRTESKTLAWVAQGRFELWTRELTWFSDDFKNTKYPFVVDVLQSYEPTKQPLKFLAKS
jgi:hypothetical protein